MRKFIAIGAAPKPGQSREDAFGDIMLEVVRAAFKAGIDQGMLVEDATLAVKVAAARLVH